MPLACIKTQAADALLQLLTDGEDKINFNDTLPALMIVPVDKTKEVEEIDEKQHVVSVVPKATALELLTVFTTATTPTTFTDLITA